MVIQVLKVIKRDGLPYTNINVLNIKTDLYDRVYTEINGDVLRFKGYNTGMHPNCHSNMRFLYVIIFYMRMSLSCTSNDRIARSVVRSSVASWTLVNNNKITIINFMHIKLFYRSNYVLNTNIVILQFCYFQYYKFGGKKKKMSKRQLTEHFHGENLEQCLHNDLKQCAYINKYIQHTKNYNWFFFFLRMPTEIIILFMQFICVKLYRVH